jgi:hypothetical protein
MAIHCSLPHSLTPSSPPQARRKEVKKRRLGSVRMHLSSGLGLGDRQIALSIYKTVRGMHACIHTVMAERRQRGVHSISLFVMVACGYMYDLMSRVVLFQLP